MAELLVPYLIAMGCFVVVVVISLLTQQFAARASRNLPAFLRYTDLRHEVEELEAVLAERRTELAQAEAIVQEANEKKRWLADNEHHIAEAERAYRELDEVDRKLSEAKDQLSLREEELGEARDKRAQAEFDANRFREQANDAVERQASAEKRLEATNKELAETQARRDSASSELAEVERRLAALRAEVDGLAAHQEARRREIELMHDERRSLTDAVEKLQAQKSELDAEVARLDTRVAGLSESVRLAGSGGGHADDPLDEVRAPAVLRVAFEDRASELGEIEALDRLDDELRQSGLVFHRRVLDAFHTALKTQSESPLLVLAGISGTGKSLLPQRYAEAMGMHSLLVPVQPRWDGPQDLLGFFNYLEGRYKPTELTRALAQFDRFCTLGDGDRLAARMLLVLLDEMNLARVEYYFSEFLSRLEARRGLDAEDEDRRANASIAIEVGAGGEGEEPTTERVFADRNVLFVGTINEDESTQTMSDKVVDRANIMRFGKPASLKKNDGGATRASTRSRPYLPRTVWESWIDDTSELSHSENERVQGWIGTLNEALQHVGKPFAYRTSDAMLAYVRQYPDRTEARIKMAMADQIEQRIMPKLRGVDPSEDAGGRAIDGIRSVVEGLGDPEFLEAIEQGRQAVHGHSFLWRGVDRKS